MGDLAQGWGWPANARKAHYFEKGEIMPLCRGWMFTGRRVDGNHDSPDNCKRCMKKLAARPDSGGTE